MAEENTTERDYFSDRSVLLDPYNYFEEIFARGPVYQLQTHDALMVTGYEEAIEVLRNNQDFFSLISLPGAAARLPFEPEGDDISEQIEAHRDKVFGSNLLTAYDGERHFNLRSVASRIFTPIRLKENEAFMREYIEDRRDNPRDDVLTTLATSTYPDGSEVPVEELVTLSAFLFAAGQDTSAKLLANAVRHIVEIPGLQRQLRDNRDFVPTLIEEVLRLEGSTKMTARIAVRNTRIGDVDVPAGKRVAVALAAANRDPRRWENPREFEFDRPRIKEHLSFGRGVHTCLGAPLTRAEVRIMLDRLLEHTSHIDMSEAKHGEPDARRLEYEPTWILRGLEYLHLELQAS